MSEAAVATKGHNRPPVIPPTDEAMLEELQGRFPELDQQMAQFEKDLATYPDKLTLKDADVAQALQDLLAKMKKHMTILKAHKKSEKAPWSTVVNVVVNFFTSREEKLEKIQDQWEAVHKDYLLQKKDETDRLAEEEAARQRARAEAAKKEQEEADRKAAEARQRQLDQERREAEARERAAEQERLEREAKERADAAAAAEKRQADERKAREREERQLNADNLKQIGRYMKDAMKLHDAAGVAGDETPEGDVRQLDALIRPGGMISNLAAPVANSHLLDDEQRAEIDDVRNKLNSMRSAVNERLDNKERRRRAKEAKEADEREAKLREERRLAREAEDRERERLAEERRKAEADQAAASQGKKDAKAEVQDARGAQREAYSDQKTADKASARAGSEADRSANRADRIDRQNANATDADKSRERGELGSLGSLKRRWVHIMPEDETALRAVCGPLGGNFTSDALSGAVFQWMRAHQSAFTGERIEPEELPGVVFAYEIETQIKS